jgi:hypothetical protein
MIHNIEILGICIQAMLLVLWFNTNFVNEYINVLKYNDAFKKYKKEYGENSKYTFIDYLKYTYTDNFFIKLLTCVYCFSTWTSLIIALCINNIYAFPFIFIFGNLLYSVIKALNNDNK